MKEFLNTLLTSQCVSLLIMPAESFHNLALYHVNYPAGYQVDGRTDGRTDILTEDIGCPPLRGTVHKALQVQTLF